MSLASQLGSRFKIELIARIIGVVTGGILTVVLARLLDPDGYGLLFLSISILGVANILSQFGVGKSAARYIAQYKERDYGQIPHILSISLAIGIFPLTIVIILFISSYEHISYLVGEPDLTPFLLLGTLFIVFSTTMKFNRYVLQGFENITMSAIVHATNRTLRLVFVIFLVLFGYGALGALAGYIFAFFVSSFIGMAYLYINYYRCVDRSPRDSNLHKRITKYTIPLTATSAANVLDKRVDTILVGLFLNPTAVAFYTIGKQAVTFIATPISALGFAIAPSYETQRVGNNTKTTTKIYETSLIHGLLFYIPAAAGLLIISEDVIFIIFGGEYTGAVPVLQVLTIYIVMNAMNHVASRGLDFLGRAKHRAVAQGVTSVSNVFLNVILIPTFGVIGAAIATVMTYSVYTFANIYIITTELNVDWNLIVWNVVKICIITAVMSLIVYNLSIYITNMVILLVVCCIGFAVWLFLSIILGMININRIYSVLV